MKSSRMVGLLTLSLLFAFIIFPGLAFSTITPTFYVTIQKSADQTEFNLGIGEFTTVQYTITLTVYNTVPSGCYLPLSYGQCIRVTDSQLADAETADWKICYAEVSAITSFPAQYTFSYAKQLGPFEDCGDYYVDNEACIVYNPTETPTPCCVQESVHVYVPCDGDDGCTPGYWKNHLDSWPATGYSPSDSFFAVFGVDLGYLTLGEAVNAKGGGSNVVARHGTAALLSAAHPDVGYPYTVDEVIALVQAGDADSLVAANELGCPID